MVSPPLVTQTLRDRPAKAQTEGHEEWEEEEVDKEQQQRKKAELLYCYYYCPKSPGAAFVCVCV